jgi:hypothetical protein
MVPSAPWFAAVASTRQSKKKNDKIFHLILSVWVSTKSGRVRLIVLDLVIFLVIDDSKLLSHSLDVFMENYDR